MGDGGRQKPSPHWAETSEAQANPGTPWEEAGPFQPELKSRDLACSGERSHFSNIVQGLKVYEHFVNWHTTRAFQKVQPLLVEEAKIFSLIHLLVVLSTSQIFFKLRSRVGGGRETKAGLQKAVLLCRNWKALLGRRNPGVPSPGAPRVKANSSPLRSADGPPDSCPPPWDREGKGTPHPGAAAAASTSPVLGGGGGRSPPASQFPRMPRNCPRRLSISCCTNLTYSAAEHLTERASLSDFIHQYKKPVAGATDELSIPTDQCTHTHTPLPET